MKKIALISIMLLLFLPIHSQTIEFDKYAMNNIHIDYMEINDFKTHNDQILFSKNIDYNMSLSLDIHPTYNKFENYNSVNKIDLINGWNNKNNFNQNLYSLVSPSYKTMFYYNNDGPKPEGLTFRVVGKSTLWGAIYGTGIGFIGYLINLPEAEIKGVIPFTLVGGALGLIGALLFAG